MIGALLRWLLFCLLQSTCLCRWCGSEVDAQVWSAHLPWHSGQNSMSSILALYLAQDLPPTHLPLSRLYPPPASSFLSRLLSLPLREFLQYFPAGKVLAFIFCCTVFFCHVDRKHFSLLLQSPGTSLTSEEYGLAEAVQQKRIGLDHPAALGVAMGSAPPLSCSQPWLRSSNSRWE